MVAVSSRPYEFFRPDPCNPRKHFPEDELRPLGESLKKKQLVPLIARKSGLIVDGERRWRAAGLVGLASLDAILIEDTAPASEIKEIQLITALHRADLKPYEVFCGFQDWLKIHTGATAKELAAALDRSESAVSKTLSLSRCIAAVQEAAREGKIGLQDWYAISQGNEQQQLEMLTARLNGASSSDIKRVRSKPAAPQVKLSRCRCALSSGKSVVVSGPEMTLQELIDTLALALEHAKKASRDSLDIRTFEKVLKDKAKAG